VYYTAVQGVKLAIFDVSDVANPLEIHKEVIGDRGTQSEATSDHKAFLFDKEKGLLVVPILLAEVSEKQKEIEGWQSREGDFTFQGAYVYSISLNKGFELRGRVTHLDDPQELLKSGYYFSSPYSVKRSLYMDDVLYTVSSKKVKMSDLNDLSYVNEVELPYEDDDGYPYWDGPEIVF
jgi:inhibitor of cysteine peptidase